MAGRSPKVTKDPAAIASTALLLASVAFSSGIGDAIFCGFLIFGFLDLCERLGF